MDNMLIIDRAGAIAGPLEAALADSGFKVDIHTPGQTAPEKVHYADYRIVLASTDLPGLDYPRLLSDISAQAPKLPVIATAEAGSVKGAVAAMQAGAVDYLLKPCHPEALLLAVQKALAVQDTGDPSLGCFCKTDHYPGPAGC